MDKMFDVAAGIDVHRDTVVVSVRRRDKEVVQTQTFETFSDSLEKMEQWLEEQSVEVVWLESTGVYWKPVVAIIQRRLPQVLVWLVNPAEVKKVPGRKTDVTDSQWLSKLVMYGLVSPAWQIPPEETAEVKAAFSQPGCLEAALGYYRALGLHLPPALRGKITLPSVLFSGADDGILRRADYERHTQLLPGSIARRLDPGDTGYENLFVAGDWVRNDYEVGNIEGRRR